MDLGIPGIHGKLPRQKKHQKLSLTNESIKNPKPRALCSFSSLLAARALLGVGAGLLSVAVPALRLACMSSVGYLQV